jgi:VWFA-related protein
VEAGFLLVMALAICGLRGSAQVDVSGWPQVRVEMIALDAQGEPLRGLTKDALVVKETDREPHAINDLQPDGEPQSVCVLVDAAGLMYDRLGVVLAKARRLVKTLPAEDEVCVADYANDLFLDQKFTNDRAALDAALSQVRASGGAGERDALIALAGYMRTLSKYKSRAIILFSDGRDDKSKAGWGEVTKVMESQGSPVVHLICVPQAFGNAKAKQNDPEMKAALEVTKPTGGLTYFPHNMTDFNSIVDNLESVLRSRYVLTFQAENTTRSGQEQPMQVSFEKTHRTEKAEVLAPEGYYAPSH